jgi:hypothetical protein
MVLTSAPARARVLNSTDTYFKIYFSVTLSALNGMVPCPGNTLTKEWSS